MKGQTVCRDRLFSNVCNVKRDVFACPKMSQFMDSHFPILDAASVAFVKLSLIYLLWSQRCDPGTGLLEHFKGR